MSRRQRLQQARLAEARALYLHARCDAGLAGLRQRLRRYRGAWLTAAGFASGMLAARLPGRRLLMLAGTVMRLAGFLRVPISALLIGSRAAPGDAPDAIAVHKEHA